MPPARDATPPFPPREKLEEHGLATGFGVFAGALYAIGVRLACRGLCPVFRWHHLNSVLVVAIRDLARLAPTLRVSVWLAIDPIAAESRFPVRVISFLQPESFARFDVRFNHQLLAVSGVSQHFAVDFSVHISVAPDQGPGLVVPHFLGADAHATFSNHAKDHSLRVVPKYLLFAIGKTRAELGFRHPARSVRSVIQAKWAGKLSFAERQVVTLYL